jgi:Tannase and feruloyl esterase
MLMKDVRLVFAVSMLWASWPAPDALAQATPPPPLADAVAACEALRSPENAAKFARIPDAPSSINSARIVPAGGTHGAADDDLPEICRVEGVIAPTVGFLLRMPTKDWNGKFMMGGCGGPCGNYLEDRIDPALVRRYAVVNTDMGHKGAGWLFGYNNLQGQVDFAYRATHLTAVVAKQLIEAFYGNAASRNYFNGCSTGGRQAMIAAQRFPHDFEGIIAGAPVYDEVGDTPYFLEWNMLVNTAKDGSTILTEDKLEVLHQAVLKKCDALDGLADGLLMNPARCEFDPKSIVCKGGQDAARCLSAEQADVVQKFRDGARNSKGEKLYFGMPWGSEDQWKNFFGWVSPTGRQRDVVGTSITGYLGFESGAPKGPEYRIRDFDYDAHPQRLDLTGVIYNPVNPDLSRFRKAGGKLILFTGWHDNNIPPEATIAYYEAAIRANGGEAATKEFFRLFLPPAVNHCRGGDGGGEVDWISALENWVERGVAPDVVMAHRPIQPYVTAPRALEDYGSTYSKLGRHPMLPGSYDRARPVFPYPAWTRYSGKGDPADPKSWVQVAR